MTTYLISFKVQGPSLDTVVSSLINTVDVLDLAIGVEGAVPTLAEFTNGRLHDKRGKHAGKSQSLTNRGRMWQIVQSIDKKFNRPTLIKLAENAGIAPTSISSALADWTKRNKIKKLGHGEYQRLA